MKKRITYQSETVTLRQKAEALLERNSQKADTLPNEAGTLKLIHELQVHQIELEMQNQELIQAKARAEAATKELKYSSILPRAVILLLPEMVKFSRSIRWVKSYWGRIGIF